MTQTAITSSSSAGEDPQILLGARIREAREQAGITNKRLADQLRLDVRTIAGWQSKTPRSRPNYERLVALAEFLGKPVSFFLDA